VALPGVGCGVGRVVSVRGVEVDVTWSARWVGGSVDGILRFEEMVVGGCDFSLPWSCCSFL
jgi:hypothetical protein